jgi:cbb3-type cytochrome oxidase cytochrome c subunit
MRSSDDTFFNLKRLHLVFAVSSTMLLAVTIWMIAVDHWRPWREYQRTFRDRIEPWMTEAHIRDQEQAGNAREVERLRQQLDRQRSRLARRLQGLPLVDGFARPLGIEQIWLPELTIDYHFRPVARFDRCITCHEGIDKSKPLAIEVHRGLAHPYAAHPRPDLFLGANSPHPAAEFGCTICHDGQGSATDFTLASHTPNSPHQRLDWRQRHGWYPNEHWDLPMLPARFAESRCLKCHHDVSQLEPSRRFPNPPAPKLLAGYHLVRQSGCFGCHPIHGRDDSGRSLGPDLRLEPEGTMRKVGPSLRDVGQRLDTAFLVDHTDDPTRFRPATRMPRLFGLHEHLEGPALQQNRRLEAVEIHAIAEYLLANSRPSPLNPTPAGFTETPSAERGKRLFQVQGCLACHQHESFPEGQSVFGPDLSRLGSKYHTVSSQQWLASWLRKPTRHSPRTKMPGPLLEPVALAAGSGQAGKPRLTDAAADLAAWLVSSRGGETGPPAPVAAADVDELARLYPELKLDSLSQDQKLQELGRRTIRKRGCFGCHDVAGFEEAQPIGPSLADWGRKQVALLAFERISEFIQGKDIGDPFYREAFLGRRRESFLWQKLGAPRSFDYKQARVQSFNEQLLMGRFTLTDQQREAIITFVLGLVAQPPAARYLDQPGSRRRALVEGRQVIDQHGCAECHTLELERWTIQYDPAKFPMPPPAADFAFLKPPLDEAVIAASRKMDRRGLARVELVGMPRVDDKGHLQEGEDDDGNPVYAFSLWEPAAIGGRVWTVGGPDVLVPRAQVIARRPPLGGQFARLLYPVVLAEARASGASAAQAEAWGWLPPTLAEIGRTVQPQWMYQYLLGPRVIRPASVLRMPKFNLSLEEARKLADYFSALGAAEFPYTAPADLLPATAAEEQARLARCDRALKFLIDRKTYCAKCHRVGDYAPGGENRTVLAPALDQVGRRIRPGYLRRWLANPKSVLPYTAMPVNFPPTGEPLGQDLLCGTSLEQLDAVRELLLYYDWYMGRRHSVRQMVEGK